MRNIKKYLAIFGLSVLSASAYADWLTATNTGESRTGDIFYTQCHYETLGGLRFSITVKGICPFSVKYNPETGQVQR